MNARTEARSGRRSPQRWASMGFVVGLLVTVPATFFALLSPTGEALLLYLVPSTELLAPLADVQASWPGMLNVAIASLVNALVYALAAGALGVVLGARRRR